MKDPSPESMARAVMEACADCDICRHLMEDTPCLLFPELYRLYDREARKEGTVAPEEWRKLVELCNFCAICPCPNIRSDIMKAKHAFIARDGLKPAIRLLEDVERVARICGAYPRLTNLLFQSRWSGGILRSLAGIHAERKVPEFPEESFPAWARERGLHELKGGTGRKVALFAGCTGRYLFPDVPRAVVDVLERNHVRVYVPEQCCCGMPTLLEGDRELTLELASRNVARLTEAVEAGCDIVCSCPTCGYMLKMVLSEGACHALEDPESADTSSSTSKAREPAAEPDHTESQAARKPVFEGIFRDEGYFASIDGARRLEISRHTHDLGEYLLMLHRSGELSTEMEPVPGKVAYYPPCHLREQKIGMPYLELLSLVPGISIEPVEGAFTCCGIAGIMGFKRDFHEVSVSMGGSLMDRIKAIDPERLVTDCLSCRIQFNQLLHYRVFHPVEILREACRGRDPRSSS